jgi:predicted small lipoprotein YifL
VKLVENAVKNSNKPINYLTVGMLCLLFSGCGYRGALYLPEDKPQTSQQEEQESAPDNDQSSQKNQQLSMENASN